MPTGKLNGVEYRTTARAWYDSDQGPYEEWWLIFSNGTQKWLEKSDENLILWDEKKFYSFSTKLFKRIKCLKGGVLDIKPDSYEAKCLDHAGEVVSLKPGNKIMVDKKLLTIFESGLATVRETEGNAEFERNDKFIYIDLVEGELIPDDELEDDELPVKAGAEVWSLEVFADRLYLNSGKLVSGKEFKWAGGSSVGIIFLIIFGFFTFMFIAPVGLLLLIGTAGPAPTCELSNFCYYSDSWKFTADCKSSLENKCEKGCVLATGLCSDAESLSCGDGICGLNETCSQDCRTTLASSKKIAPIVGARSRSYGGGK